MGLRTYTPDMIPVTQALPRAPYSWESRAILLGNRQETGKIRMAFSRPVLIVAAHVSISTWASGERTDAETLDDIDIQIEIDRGERFTQFNDESPNQGGSFVTLASIDQVRAGRYLDMQLDTAAPVLQITYRHQRPVEDWDFADHLIKTTFFAQYLK